MEALRDNDPDKLLAYAIEANTIITSTSAIAKRALVEAVTGLFDDPGTAAALGNAGRDRIVRLYDRNETLGRLRGLLGIPEGNCE